MSLFLQIQEDAFYVFDVQDLIQKYNNWKEKLPRIIPHYGKRFCFAVGLLLLKFVLIEDFYYYTIYYYYY